ncbi:MAG: bestrophin family protein [Luteibaculum sp.]
MHAGSHFKLKEAVIWTRRNIYKFTAIALVEAVLYQVVGLKWLSLPWLPMALIGTAVAFLIGFKNNATYDRLWEARKIWGAIVNDSRTWAIQVLDFISNQYADLNEEDLQKAKQRLIYRHIAWLAALRHQLRQPKAWETMESKNNKEYRKFFSVREYRMSLDEELKSLIDPAEQTHILSKKNRATHLLAKQSEDLKNLRKLDYLNDFRLIAMQATLKEFYTHQGKCERIKNFPYPRQFATLNRYFVWLFLILLPLGMLSEFEKLGSHMVWLTIPFSVLVSWVFHTMDIIGEATENPFQGGANDVPITNLSRTIEIDLRELLNEQHIPEPTVPENNILM